MRISNQYKRIISLLLVFTFLTVQGASANPSDHSLRSSQLASLIPQQLGSEFSQSPRFNIPHLFKQVFSLIIEFSKPQDRLYERTERLRLARFRHRLGQTYANVSRHDLGVANAVDAVRKSMEMLQQELKANFPAHARSQRLLAGFSERQFLITVLVGMIFTAFYSFLAAYSDASGGEKVLAIGIIPFLRKVRDGIEALIIPQYDPESFFQSHPPTQVPDHPHWQFPGEATSWHMKEVSEEERIAIAMKIFDCVEAPYLLADQIAHAQNDLKRRVETCIIVGGWPWQQLGEFYVFPARVWSDHGGELTGILEEAGLLHHVIVCPDAELPKSAAPGIYAILSNKDTLFENAILWPTGKDTMYYEAAAKRAGIAVISDRDEQRTTEDSSIIVVTDAESGLDSLSQIWSATISGLLISDNFDRRMKVSEWQDAILEGLQERVSSPWMVEDLLRGDWTIDRDSTNRPSRNDDVVSLGVVSFFSPDSHTSNGKSGEAADGRSHHVFDLSSPSSQESSSHIHQQITTNLSDGVTATAVIAKGQISSVKFISRENTEVLTLSTGEGTILKDRKLQVLLQVHLGTSGLVLSNIYVEAHAPGMGNMLFEWAMAISRQLYPQASYPLEVHQIVSPLGLYLASKVFEPNTLFFRASQNISNVSNGYLRDDGSDEKDEWEHATPETVLAFAGSIKHGPNTILSIPADLQQIQDGDYAVARDGWHLTIRDNNNKRVTYGLSFANRIDLRGKLRKDFPVSGEPGEKSQQRIGPAGQVEDSPGGLSRPETLPLRRAIETVLQRRVSWEFEATHLLEALNLNADAQIEGLRITQISSNNLDGYKLLQLTLPTTVRDRALPTGKNLDVLRYELIKDKDFKLDAFYLMIDNRGPVAVFPVVSQQSFAAVEGSNEQLFREIASHGISYIDLSNYDLPINEGSNSARAWSEAINRWRNRQAAITSIKQFIYHNWQSKVALHGRGHASGLLVSYDMDPKIRVFSPKEVWPEQMGQERDDISLADHRLLLRRFPTVYSQGAPGHKEEDAAYYSYMLKELGIGQTERVVVIGPGMGTEILPVAWLSNGPVDFVTINPLERANVLDTASIANIKVRWLSWEALRKQINQYDYLLFNMPALVKQGTPMGLEDLWDTDVDGKVLLQTSAVISLVLKRQENLQKGGQALIWNNFIRLQYHTKSGEAFDPVELVLAYGGKYSLQQIIEEQHFGQPRTLDVKYQHSGIYVVRRYEEIKTEKASGSLLSGRQEENPRRDLDSKIQEIMASYFRVLEMNGGSLKTLPGVSLPESDQDPFWKACATNLQLSGETLVGRNTQGQVESLAVAHEKLREVWFAHEDFYQVAVQVPAAGILAMSSHDRIEFISLMMGRKASGIDSNSSTQEIVQAFSKAKYDANYFKETLQLIKPYVPERYQEAFGKYGDAKVAKREGLMSMHDLSRLAQQGAGYVASNEKFKKWKEFWKGGNVFGALIGNGKKYELKNQKDFPVSAALVYMPNHRDANVKRLAPLINFAGKPLALIGRFSEKDEARFEILHVPNSNDHYLQSVVLATLLTLALFLPALRWHVPAFVPKAFFYLAGGMALVYFWRDITPARRPFSPQGAALMEKLIKLLNTLQAIVSDSSAGSQSHPIGSSDQESRVLGQAYYQAA